MDSKYLDPLKRYEEYATFQFAYNGEGRGLRQARAALKLRLAMSHSVRELDEIVVEAVRVNDYIDPALLEDDAEQPLAHWWWHLGKLRQHTYPAYLLPEHLRSIYQELTERAA